MLPLAAAILGELSNQLVHRFKVGAVDQLAADALLGDEAWRRRFCRWNVNEEGNSPTPSPMTPAERPSGPRSTSKR